MRYNTIVGGPARKNDPQTIEGLITVAAIKPGSLLYLTNGNVKAHDIAGAKTPAILALSNHTGGQDVRDSVAIGETGIGVMCEDDVIYHALVAPSTAVVKGDQLCSAGNGTLKKVSAGTDVALFFAFETVTLGASADLVAVRKI